jgi:AhpD family alkylhydroperoxidase
MKATFGTVPAMMKVYPEHMRAGVWEWFKSTMSPDAAVPPKYSQLISLAVASQIPCEYCIYAHTTMAKMFGATDAEIQEAVASAADVRHWSTVMNGNGIDVDEFKKEWDGILAHLKKQSETK